jgi:hypothetical protein
LKGKGAEELYMHKVDYQGLITYMAEKYSSSEKNSFQAVAFSGENLTGNVEYLGKFEVEFETKLANA